jgi:hypothetical protein
LGGIVRNTTLTADELAAERAAYLDRRAKKQAERDANYRPPPEVPRRGRPRLNLNVGRRGHLSESQLDYLPAGERGTSSR